MRKASPLLALVFALAVPAAAQAPRPGATLRFATLGSSGGLEGSAFLPIAPSDVRLVQRSASCARSRVELRARGLRGLVRELRMSLPEVSSAGEISVGAGCDQATIRAKLDDGAEVEGTGSIRVTSVATSGPVKLEIDLSWSPRVRGQTLPMTGHVVVPQPPTP